MDKFFLVFGKVVVITLGAGLLLGGGYYLAMNSGFSLKRAGNSNSSVSTEATLGPSSTPGKTFKTITAGVSKSAKLAFSQYTITFPEDWTVNDQKDDALPSDKLVLTKGTYSISIFQGATGGGQCVYPGDPTPQGPAGVFGTYTEFPGTQGTTFRRGSIDSTNIATQNFGVCAKTSQNTLFGQPTQFGHILYIAPKNSDQVMLSEMDSIVASLTKAQ